MYISFHQNFISDVYLFFTASCLLSHQLFCSYFLDYNVYGLGGFFGLDVLNIISFIMDESEMAEMLEQKRENPRLKRPPLELGTKFTNYSDHQNIVQLESPLNHTEILLLLFGAEWCNITKSFVNKVKSHYKQINLEQKNVEIIYVSLDKSEKDYDMFTQKFPWLGIKFDDPRVKSLREFYNVKAIPSLILLDDKGEEIGSCREDVYHLSEDDAYSKWKKRKESTQPLMKVESEQDIE